ncbi:hypothetical protein PFISCL1PPCAC_18725, partial [Pristionchus fissidentatus]
FVFDQFGTWRSLYKRETFVSLVVCAVRPSSYSPSNPISSPCTESWTQLPGGFCYQLTVLAELQTPTNIYDAEMQCRSQGGHLPAILSGEQTNLIQAFLTGLKRQNSQFWIGLYCNWAGRSQLSHTGQRAWIDGSPYNKDYSNFLDEEDDDPSCNINLVDTFLYNGALKGKWQKQKFDTTLNVLMCTRQTIEFMTNSATSTVTTTAIIPTTTTDQPLTEEPTDPPDDPSPPERP